jgi:hypothetical protein
MGMVGEGMEKSFEVKLEILIDDYIRKTVCRGGCENSHDKCGKRCENAIWMFSVFKKDGKHFVKGNVYCEG